MEWKDVLAIRPIPPNLGGGRQWASCADATRLQSRVIAPVLRSNRYAYPSFIST
jgi:hypothetical protein